METKKTLRMQIEHLSRSNERYFRGMKVIAEKAEKLEEENTILREENNGIGQKYREAMMANQVLTEQWEKLNAVHEQLMKEYKTMEHAVEVSEQVRKKLCIQNRMLTQELEKFGYSFERDDGELIIHRPEGSEENEA